MAVKTTILLTSALTALCVAATTVTAQAGGFAVREQSIYGLGTSFAGIAAPGASPSSMFWNPAAVTAFGPGFVGESNFTFIIPRAEIDVITATGPLATSNGLLATPTTLVPSPFGPVPAAAVAPTVARGAGAPTLLRGQNLGTNGTGDIAQDALVPSSYSALNLGMFGFDDRIAVGLAITAPFGLVTKNDFNSAARFHGRTSELRVINAMPTVGFQFNDLVAVGVGLQVSYIDVRLTQASPLPSPVPGIGLQADTEFEGDDIAFGASAGLTLTPTPTTTIGVGFRSAIDHRLEGEAKIAGPSSVLARPLGDITADVILPETVTVGLRQRVTPRFTALAGYEFTNWSRFDELRVDFITPDLPDNVTAQNYEDGHFFTLGAEFAATEALTLRTGAAYEISPIEEEFRTPRVPDSDRIWVSAGATYALSDRFSLDASYAHIFPDEAPITLEGAEDPGRGTFIADASGSVDIFGVSLRYKLGGHSAPVEPVVETYFKP